MPSLLLFRMRLYWIVPPVFVPPIQMPAVSVLPPAVRTSEMLLYSTVVFVVLMGLFIERLTEWTDRRGWGVSRTGKEKAP